jgi:hypothetical protein
MPQLSLGDRHTSTANTVLARRCRTAEDWDRDRAVDGCQVHGQTSAWVRADLEDLPAQPCAWPRRHGLLVVPTIKFGCCLCWWPCDMSGDA